MICETSTNTFENLIGTNNGVLNSEIRQNNNQATLSLINNFQTKPELKVLPCSNGVAHLDLSITASSSTNHIPVTTLSTTRINYSTNSLPPIPLPKPLSLTPRLSTTSTCNTSRRSSTLSLISSSRSNSEVIFPEDDEKRYVKICYCFFNFTISLFLFCKKIFFRVDEDEDETLLLSYKSANGTGGWNSRRPSNDEEDSETLGDLSFCENFSISSATSELFTKTFSRQLQSNNLTENKNNSLNAKNNLARGLTHSLINKPNRKIDNVNANNASKEMVCGMMNQMPVSVLQHVLGHFSYNEVF